MNEIFQKLAESWQSDKESPQIAIIQLIEASWALQSIHTAATLGIADLLADGPKNVNDLATACSADANALYRLLRALASIGMFSEVEKSVFALTPLAETLRTNAPDSMNALAMMVGDECHRSWDHMVHSVKTGEVGFKSAFGKEIFQFLPQNPERGMIFNKAMIALATEFYRGIPQAYDFSSFNKIIDIGGGVGTLLMFILREYAQLQATLFELPPVAEHAKRFVAAVGIAERCEIVAGNFFESVPAGGDAYIMSMVLHGCNDEQCIQLLKNCHAVMPKHAKLLVVEMVIPTDDRPFYGKFMDLNMLAMSGGCERTEAEYRHLFEAAGFELTKVYPTGSPMAIVEGTLR